MKKFLGLALAVICGACTTRVINEGDVKQGYTLPKSGVTVTVNSEGDEGATINVPREQSLGADNDCVCVGAHGHAPQDTDPSVEESVDGADSSDAGVDATVAEADAEQDDEEETDATAASATLEVTYDGPAANDIWMGEAANMYCFSLRARGADFNITLPASEIRGVDGASVQTASSNGAVFGTGKVKEGIATIATTGAMTITNDALVYDELPNQVFLTEDGDLRRLCLEFDVVDASETPRDFYQKEYVFVMGDWTETGVTYADSGKSLSRDQIVSPFSSQVIFPRSEIVGNGMRIQSRTGYPGLPEYYFCSANAGDISNGCCSTKGFHHDFAAPQRGSLIKSSSSPMVYYYGSDDRRYVFPNEDVLISWYAPNILDGASGICANVQEYPEEVVGDIAIGGNVTIRPGSFLVRIETDPKIYAISQGRILHWIGNQPMLDGRVSTGIVWDVFSDATKRVRVIPDAFFVNYLIGQDITDITQYDARDQYDRSLEAELGIQ